MHRSFAIAHSELPALEEPGASAKGVGMLFTPNSRNLGSRRPTLTQTSRRSLGQAVRLSNGTACSKQIYAQFVINVYTK